jgi:quercetin dioxygenase-like cupin family protein
MNAQSPVTAPNWRERVVFAPDGPKPQTLLDTPQFRVIVAGLEPGQKIPQHPAPAAVYTVLEGSGWMFVAGERFAVEQGSTVVVPAGATRGFEATTRLVFIGARGAD